MVGVLCDWLWLMFFGNLYQDWSEFVFVDFGVFQYESVLIVLLLCVFQQCGDVDVYFVLQMCCDVFDVWFDDLLFDDLICVLDVVGCVQLWFVMCCVKLLFVFGQVCECCVDWDVVFDVYMCSVWFGSWYWCICVFECCGCDDDVFVLVFDVCGGFESDEEWQCVECMLLCLQCCVGQCVECVVVVVDVLCEMFVFVCFDVFVSVEFVVCDYFVQLVLLVYYVENMLINLLFGLLCWEFVFVVVFGVFFYLFQCGLVDLYVFDFVVCCVVVFDVCFVQFDLGVYCDMICWYFVMKVGL